MSIFDEAVVMATTFYGYLVACVIGALLLMVVLHLIPTRDGRTLLRAAVDALFGPPNYYDE